MSHGHRGEQETTSEMGPRRLPAPIAQLSTPHLATALVVIAIGAFVVTLASLGDRGHPPGLGGAVVIEEPGIAPASPPRTPQIGVLSLPRQPDNPPSSPELTASEPTRSPAAPVPTVPPVPPEESGKHRPDQGHTSRADDGDNHGGGDD
jgi:hypothetical protein